MGPKRQQGRGEQVKFHSRVFMSSSEGKIKYKQSDGQGQGEGSKETRRINGRGRGRNIHQSANPPTVPLSSSLQEKVEAAPPLRPANSKRSYAVGDGGNSGDSRLNETPINTSDLIRMRHKESLPWNTMRTAKNKTMKEEARNEHSVGNWGEDCSLNKDGQRRRNTFLNANKQSHFVDLIKHNDESPDRNALEAPWNIWKTDESILSELTRRESFDTVVLSEELQLRYQNMMADQQQQRKQWTSQSSQNDTKLFPTVQQNVSSPPCTSMEIDMLPNSSEELIILDSTEIYANPAIFVIPLRPVNFAGVLIQFTIQVFNLPPGCFVATSMLEAIAQSPSMTLLMCQIRKENRYESREPSSLEEFLGSFRATDETGLYTLRVRLVLPFRFPESAVNFKSYTGVAGDMVNILVSRNYFRESRKTPVLSYQMKFQAFESVNCGEAVIASSKAWGIACDKATNLIYFTERVSNQVSCMDPKTGQILFQFNQTSQDSMLSRPTGICCDEYNRRILLCDKDHHRICIFTMKGDFITSFGKIGHQNGMFSYPWDVSVNFDGSRIVVADSRNKRIQLFDGSGNFISKFSVFEQNPFEYKSQLDYPRGICFDADGQLIYVTDFNSQSVIQVPIKFDSARRLVTEKCLIRPQGIVVDSIGGFLVADSKSNCICHYSGDGQLLSIIRSVGSASIQYPVNLTLMQNGIVALLDGRGRIYMF